MWLDKFVYQHYSDFDILNTTLASNNNNVVLYFIIAAFALVFVSLYQWYTATTGNSVWRPIFKMASSENIIWISTVNGRYSDNVCSLLRRFIPQPSETVENNVFRFSFHGTTHWAHMILTLLVKILLRFAENAVWFFIQLLFLAFTLMHGFTIIATLCRLPQFHQIIIIWCNNLSRCLSFESVKLIQAEIFILDIATYGDFHVFFRFHSFAPVLTWFTKRHQFRRRTAECNTDLLGIFLSL